MLVGVVAIGKPFPRHGGFKPAIKKILQGEQANPASNGPGMIDEFRLWGSRPCRRMGGHLTKGGRRMEVAHEVARPFNNPNAPLSEGESPRRCGPGCAGKAAWDTGWHGFPASAATTVAGRPPACPRLARYAAPGGGGSGGSDPGFFAAGAAPGRSKVVTAVKIHHFASPFRGRSLHSDPWREGHRALPRFRADQPDRSGFPTGGGTCGPLRGESAQEAFRGALLCQGVRKSSLPGKAGGFRGGQDTVERFPVASRAIETSVMGEGEGSGGGDGGARGALSPRSGV